jgi:thioredoxin reductase
MAHVSIVGGGAAGLSAALFAAKNGLETTVFDTDDTWMHNSHLLNNPGVGSRDGTAFLETLRTQVEAFGAELRQGEAVTDVAEAGDGFAVETVDGEYEADYLVVATGADRELAESLGCAFDGDVVDVDLSMETSVADAYATGAMVREGEWQAVIAAGDGAAAALNVLSKERGENFHDFDTPGEAHSAFETLLDRGE